MQVTAAANLDALICYIAGGIAVLAIALCGVRARQEYGKRWVSLLLFTGVVLFLLQMLQFPLMQTGLTMHFLGAGLLVLIFGPYFTTVTLALICLAQGLMLSSVDHLATLANLANLAVVASWVTYLVYRSLMRLKVPLFFSAGLGFLLGSVFSSLLVAFEWSMSGTGFNRSLVLTNIGMYGLRLAVIETVICLILWMMLQRLGRRRYYDPEHKSMRERMSEEARKDAQRATGPGGGKVKK